MISENKIIFKMPDESTAEEKANAVKVALAYHLPVDTIPNPAKMQTDVYIRIPKGLIFVRDVIGAQLLPSEVNAEKKLKEISFNDFINILMRAKKEGEGK